MALVYVNGTLVSEISATISTFDHGLVVGDGAFETVLLHNGRPFALRRHLERLNRSLNGLDLAPADLAEVARAVEAVIDTADYQHGRIRITVTAGRGPLGSGRLNEHASLVVATTPAEPIAQSSMVQTVPWPRNERGALVGLKTISYAENALALSYAHERGADEAIFSNLAGNLCEGSGSNVFFVVGGELFTPPLGSGCLAGVTRALVLEYCAAKERDLTMSEFRRGGIEEAFLTSAIRGVQPISSIDKVAIDPGPITKETRARYLSLRDETTEP